MLETKIQATGSFISTRRQTLPLLNKQEMHGSIRQNDESTAKDSEADDVPPECEDIEAERAENRCTRHFDVETISTMQISTDSQTLMKRCIC